MTISCIYHACFASFSRVRVNVKGTRNGICYRSRFKFYPVSILKNIFTIFTYQLLRQKQGILMCYISFSKLMFTKESWNLIYYDVSIRMYVRVKWMYMNAYCSITCNRTSDNWKIQLPMRHTMRHVQRLVLCWSGIRESESI